MVNRAAKHWETMIISLPLQTILEGADIVVDNARSPYAPVSAVKVAGGDLPPLCYYKNVMKKSKSHRDKSKRRVKKRSTSFPVGKMTDEIINRWDNLSLLSATTTASKGINGVTRQRDSAPLQRSRSSDDVLEMCSYSDSIFELDDLLNGGTTKADLEPRRPRRRNSDSFSKLPEATLDELLLEALDVISDMNF